MENEHEKKKNTAQKVKQLEVELKKDSPYYSCKICSYSAMTKQSLTQHIQSKHEGICYNCEQCGFRTMNKPHLKQHVESQHDGVIYNCDQCSYKAKTTIWTVLSPCNEFLYEAWTAYTSTMKPSMRPGPLIPLQCIPPVSYTHLTLPTILLV